MMHQSMSYANIATVMDSWELARQKYGCDEEIGSEILFNMFRLDPTTKTIFGFGKQQAIESNPLLRMGVLVHATQIVTMLTGVIALLGPDMETLEAVLSQVGERHKRRGVAKAHFDIFVPAICNALRDILGEEWTSDTQQAWESIFGDMANMIKESM